MAKLGYETKGDFQRYMFPVLVQKYFEGGNAVSNGSNPSFQIQDIMEGLSMAWDKAEENSPDSRFE